MLRAGRARERQRQWQRGGGRPGRAQCRHAGSRRARRPGRARRDGRAPDDRTPLSEAPFSDKSAQGAAQVVQRYFALVEERKYGAARLLWDRGGDASGKSKADFAADFGRYRDYHAEIGAPGRMEGAAGSSYVEVPVQLYGHLKDGTPFRRPAKVTLRRVNDVPGSTAEQRRWHISDLATDLGGG